MAKPQLKLSADVLNFGTLARSNKAYEKQLSIGCEDPICVEWKLDEFSYDFVANTFVRIGSQRQGTLDQTRAMMNQNVTYEIEGEQVLLYLISFQITLSTQRLKRAIKYVGPRNQTFQFLKMRCKPTEYYF